MKDKQKERMKLFVLFLLKKFKKFKKKINELKKKLKSLKEEIEKTILGNNKNSYQLKWFGLIKGNRKKSFSFFPLYWNRIIENKISVFILFELKLKFIK